MQSVTNLNFTNISSLKRDFPWMDDDSESSVVTTIQAGEVALLLHDALSETTKVISVNMSIDMTPQWQRYKANGLKLISEQCPDIFAASTQAERLTLIATETESAFFREEELSPINRGLLSAFIVHACREAVQYPHVNLIIMEDLGEEVNLRIAYVDNGDDTAPEAPDPAPQTCV